MTILLAQLNKTSHDIVASLKSIEEVRRLDELDKMAE